MRILETIEQSAQAMNILPSTRDNIAAWLDAGFLPQWALDSLAELTEAEAWEELDNRFYETIAFGTGGMRGRTIAQRETAAERGTPSDVGTPTHAAVGSAMLNDFNVIRATIGLYRYSARHLHETLERAEQPKLVIAHDMRHFSRHFCELAASTWTRLGGTAYIYRGPRTTPQLSFSVRHLRATAGVVITASHNPPHDNGYKVYFSDGAQVVSPHAEGIIHEVHAVDLSETAHHLETDLCRVVTLGGNLDTAYISQISEVVLDADSLRSYPPKTVFTPIHGAGSVSTLPALESHGVPVLTIDEQEQMDPRFPTVRSPNPENTEALEMAIARANAEGAELVIATDPDGDRMGVAVRGRDGEMELLNGNTIGALLADYRIRTLKRLARLPREGTPRAALVKTFVTTPLQERIATAHGLKVIETLTGFKFIGEKLTDYEATLRDSLLEREGMVIDYDATHDRKRSELLMKYSTWYVFGGEESYGYLASDAIRDKDGNAAALMICEVMAALKRAGSTVADTLDRIYLEHGFHLEDLINIYYEGAAGSKKIRRILESYRQDPPRRVGEWDVVGFEDFGLQTFHDADGKEIPKQDFYRIRLDNGYSYAVRGSGTEPKMKFYLFGNQEVSEPGMLDETKDHVRRTLAAIKAAVEKDAHRRADS